MEKTKEYQVVTYKTDNVFEVKVSFKGGGHLNCEVNTFGDEQQAKEHANWAMFESGYADKVDYVRVNHVIWHIKKTK